MPAFCVHMSFPTVVYKWEATGTRTSGNKTTPALVDKIGSSESKGTGLNEFYIMMWLMNM